jgi:predicted nucleic acid-binding protein
MSNRAFVDANVILRFLTGDPPEMAARATALFKAVERGEVTLLLDDIVLAEVVWVLHSYYGHPPTEISRALRDLIAHDGVEAKDKAAVIEALRLFADKNVDFADALTAVHMAGEGVAEIFSFDVHFDRLPGVVRRVPEEEAPNPGRRP